MLRTEQKQVLIKKRGNKCENCGITEWLGQPINLEIHHIDGNRQNDNEDNLQVLCPNCHSYTNNHSKNIKKHSITDEEFLQFLKNAPTIHQALLNAKLSTAGANYNRARKLVQQYELIHLYKKENKRDNYCIDCGAPINWQATRCKKCKALANRIVNRPSREELKQLIRNNSFVSIGKQYNVSDNTIRKWCKTYNLPSKKKDINNYSNEEWIKI